MSKAQEVTVEEFMEQKLLGLLQAITNGRLFSMDIPEDNSAWQQWPGNYHINDIDVNTDLNYVVKDLVGDLYYSHKPKDAIRTTFKIKSISDLLGTALIPLRINEASSLDEDFEYTISFKPFEA